jgi:hypothetical protein
MPESILADSIFATPPEITGAESFGASSKFEKAKKRTALSLLSAHGFLMSLSFFFLFPLGMIAIRMKSPSAFRLHSALQLIAVACCVSGGWIQTRTLLNGEPVSVPQESLSKYSN